MEVDLSEIDDRLSQIEPGASFEKGNDAKSAEGGVSLSAITSAYFG
jgi:hypothetical protein